MAATQAPGLNIFLFPTFVLTIFCTKYQYNVSCWLLLAAAGCTISPFYEQFLSPGVVMAAAGDWLNGTESSAKKSHGHSCPQSDQNRYSTTILLRLEFRDFEIVVFSIKCTVCSSVLLLVKKNV